MLKKEYSKYLYSVITLLILLYKTPFYAIQYPITPILPTTPTLPKVEKTTEIEKTERKPQKDLLQTIECSVLIELWGTKILEGNISLPLKIKFVHHLDNFRFVKYLSPKEINTIEILNFTIKDTKSYPNHTWYSFEPSRVQITTTDKTVFVLSSIFSFLNTLKIKTKYGSTTLYSFFADTYQTNSGWKNAKKTSKEYHQMYGHSRSIKKITFLK